jgi:hypothetical protein
MAATKTTASTASTTRNRPNHHCFRQKIPNQPTLL